MESVHNNKPRGPFCSLASYGRIRICPSRVQLSSRCRIQSCSKTCKSLHPQCNCESVWPEFLLSNERRHKILCKDIMISSWANACKSTSGSFGDGIVFRQVSGPHCSYLPTDIFYLFKWRSKYFGSKNFQLFDDPFRCDNSCTSCGRVLQWYYKD